MIISFVLYVLIFKHSPHPEPLVYYDNWRLICYLLQFIVPILLNKILSQLVNTKYLYTANVLLLLFLFREHMCIFYEGD